MDKPFFVMRNVHTNKCGTPPVVTNDVEGRYHGYFENSYGEQWVFVYDYSKKSGELRGGDANWDGIFQVVDGKVENLILGAEEAQWLSACWSAATARQ